MSSEFIYLDSYVLQQDMRIRLPKTVINNLPVKKGETRFAIYLDAGKQELILKIDDPKNKDNFI